MKPIVQVLIPRKKVVNNLIRVIGLAPSELPTLDFKERLTKERDRVRREIEIFQRKNIPKSSVAKAAKAARSELDALLKAKGLTPEKLQEMIRKKTHGG